MTRRGFTLIEVMIALVTGAIVVTLAYATLQAGTDTEARLTRANEREAALAHLRAIAGDVVRHALPGATSLQVVRDDRGHATRVDIATRGVVPPLGAGAAWMVVVERGADGVRLRASGGVNGERALVTMARGVAGFDVRFRGDLDATWRAEWRDTLRLPQAIELRFLDGDGRDLAAPLVARTSPVGGA